MNKFDGLKVEGRRGTWYEIDTREINGKEYSLVESEIWGDEAEWLLVCDGQEILDDIHDGWSDVEYAIEEGLLKL